MHPSQVWDEDLRKSLIERYRGYGADANEIALWEFIKNIPSPLSVSLDRTISTELEDGVYIDGPAKTRGPRERKVRSGMDKVRDVMRETYSNYRSTILSLNDHLKTRLVISAFRAPSTQLSTRPESFRDIGFQEIAQLEVRATRILGASLGKEANHHIKTFFEFAKDFAQHAQSSEGVKAIFKSQYRQINELTSAFDEYETKAAVAYKHIRSFLDTVNSFFIDSNKVVSFDEKTGDLAFHFARSNAVKQANSLARLSSGEKQILMLFTFLAFVSRRNQVFIVDEPELSLHPKWQSTFLESLLKQAPPGSQIILATHSPEIVGRYREKCIVLEASHG